MIQNLLLGLEPYIRATAVILMHSVWQGIFIGILAALALSLLRIRDARIRYMVMCSAMLAVLIATLLTAATVWPDAKGTTRFTAASTAQTESPAVAGDIGAPAASTDDSSYASSPQTWWRDPSVSRYTFFIWVAGVLLLSVFHLIGWYRARGFVRRGTFPMPDAWQTRFERLLDEMNINRLIPLLGSSLVKVPCVVGWIKPVILVPVGVLTMLDPSDVEMILVHELAHVRRYDVLINILQTAMETLFFFNPAVWWISNRIRIEREDCCDDAAIQRKGDQLAYARALANLEESRMFQTSFGSALTSTPLKHRIKRIAGATKPRFYSAALSFSGMVLTASLIIVALGSSGGFGNSAVQAGENVDSTPSFDPGTGDLHGEWETMTDGNKLRILVYGRASEGMNFTIDRDDVAEFVGQGRTSFQIARDAGTLYLQGTLKEHRQEIEGSGEWYFRPDTAYVHFMSRYGLPEDDQQKAFSLAMRDISHEYLTRMEEYGYSDLNVDQLISAGVFGICPELVENFRSAGYYDLPYDKLLSMCVQGVTPGEARDFENAGAGHLTADQLISARISGLTPGYVREFRDAGFKDLSFSNFLTLHGFKIDADEFEDCYRHRFMDLSEANMVWVCGFGLTQADIKRLQGRGYTNIDTIISMLAIEAGK